MRINPIGIGSFVPVEILTNKDIEDRRPRDIPPELWTNDEWILPRTGISERHIAPQDWGSSELMTMASLKAMGNAGIDKEDIDLLVATSSFPDYGFNIPRIAEVLKDKLDIPQQVLSIEENAECASFCWALARAEMEMKQNGFKRVLVVSGDKTTAATNYRDRNTCILFGDAAGAMILEANRATGPARGLIASIRGTITRQGDDQYIDAMSVPAGGSKRPFDEAALKEELQYMQMPGGAKMLEALGAKIVPQLCQALADQAGINLDKVKFIIPHQANIRISNLIDKKLGLAEGVVYKDNIKWFGNTSGSSIPLSLDTLYRQGQIKYGDLIMLVGFGAGFTYGANLISWTIV